MPKTGFWLHGVERLFGLMKRAVELRVVQPVLPMAAVLVFFGDRCYWSPDFGALAGAAGRPEMLDFYADWRASCWKRERFMVSETKVSARPVPALLHKADVTARIPSQRALLRRFGLFGLPGKLLLMKMAVKLLLPSRWPIKLRRTSNRRCTGRTVACGSPLDSTTA